MNRFKMPLTAFMLLGILLTSCKEKSGPKEVSAEFIRNLYTMNFDDAVAVSTQATKNIIIQNRAALETQGTLDAEKAKRKEDKMEAMFATKTLTEKQSGNEADVKNDAISIHLKLEDGQWKVAADEGAVQTILFKETYLENVKTAWQQLQEAYEKRAGILGEYLSYKNTSGNATAETQAIDQALKASSKVSFTNRPEWVAKHDAVTAILEKNMQPTFTAGSDLSLNYIVQLSNAKENIVLIKKAYNEAAMKARSKDFPLVP